MSDHLDFAPELDPAPERRRRNILDVRDAIAKQAAPERPAERAEPYRPFPVERLPEPLRELVDVGATSIGCDAAYIALPALVVCASLVGNARCILLKPGWTEPSVLWGAIVGRSGTLKTPALRLVLRPIGELQRDELAVHREAMAVYDAASEHYQRDLARWKRETSTGDPPTAPAEPQAARLMVQDSTVEALAAVLAANPRGVLLAMDELAGWLASFDRYSAGRGSDAPHYLSMHSAERLIIDRKTGPTRLLHVERAAVSIVGGIQPAVLDQALGVEHRQNGLLARLLLAWPPERPKRWTDAGVPAEVVARYALLARNLRELRPQTTVDGDEPIVLPLTADARRLWIAFYDEHAVEQADAESDDLAAAYSKLEAGAARFALVVHCVRLAAGDAALERSDAVDAASMSVGIELARWFAAEARRVYTLLARGDGDREHDRLIDWIRRRGGRATVRELSHGPRQYRGDAAAARAALGELVAAGLGAWELDGGGPGRPSECFVLRDGGTSGPGSKTPRHVGADDGFGAGASGAGSADSHNR